MSIASLLKLLALSSVLTLTACGTDEPTGDDGSDGGGTTQPSDRDSDGVADTADAFPDDSSESVDSDNDGVGDNADVFPNDASEQFDTDGDGVGDNADFYPNDSSKWEEDTLNVLSFNLSGAVSVVTTVNPATNTSGEGNSVGGVVSAMSKNGRKLNSFVFHETPAKSKKLSKNARSKNIQAAGYAPEIAAKLAEDSTSNFFVIDENGDLQFAAESDFDINVSYSVVWDEVTIVEEPDPIVTGATIETEVVTPYLFFALDTNEFWQSHPFVVATEGCAIFKVNVETAEWSCVEVGYAASGIDDSYRKTMSDQKRKPLQVDKDGNVFFIAKKFDMIDSDEDGVMDGVQEPNTWWQLQTLRKVSKDATEGRDLTPDNFYIESYMAMPNDTITYTAQDSLSNGQRVLKMVKNASADTPETIDLEDNVPWGDFFYAKDNANTVMYSDSQGWGKGIQFTQPRLGLRGRYSLELDTAIFSDSDWNVSPKRIILADDGSMFGLFVEESYKDNNPTFTGKLKRMLPYSPATFASFKIGNDWDDYWKFFDNGQRDVQVSKGFAYYIEEKNHTFNGERSVIRAVRLVDGQRTNLLEDADWEQTYELYNWKLSGDNIYFTGFDKAKSISISGRINTLLMKQGAAESEYLTITETSSVLGSSGKIDDLEVLQGSAPENFTGGNPQVVKYFTDQENMYSASVEFNKYMDIDSVNNGTTVSVTTKDEAGVESVVAIESDSDNDGIQDGIVLKVWLNRTMHLIFDTFIDTSDDDPDVSTQPLNTASKYTIAIDGEASDTEGFQLISGSSILNWTWNTRPTSGWYTGIAGAVLGITDGKVGKFAIESENDFTESSLAKLGYPLNVKVEYSMPSSTAYRTELYLRDSHQVDWSNVESNPTDTEGNQWKWFDGFEVLRDGSMAVKWQWVDNADWRATWRQDKAYKIAQPIIASDSDEDGTDDLFYLDTDDNNKVTYVQIPWHLFDEDTEEFYSEFWVTDSTGDSTVYRKNLGTDPLNPDQNGLLYTQTRDYYMEAGSDEKFYYDDDPNVRDYVDSQGNLIDWSKEVTYFAWAWEDENGTRNETQLDWRNGYWVNVADGAIPAVDLDDTVWQQSYYGSDINNDDNVNLSGLCQFGGPKDDLGACTNLSVIGAEAGEEYQFNGEWEWAAEFTAANFIESTEEHRWFAFSYHGGWNCCTDDRIEMLGLDSANPDWFSHDWQNNTITEGGWSDKQWVRYEYTIVTDQTGTDDLTTMTLNIYNSAGDVIQTVEKELFMDVKEASWSAFTGVDGYENDGFSLDFRLSGGDAVIDNLKVTDMSGTDDVILVDDKFSSGANVFTKQSNVGSTVEAASFNKKIKNM